MAESTEQLHERVEEMKSEMWEIVTNSSRLTRRKAVAAYEALNELADELLGRIKAEEAVQKFFKNEGQPNG